MSAAFHAQGWNKPRKQFGGYFRQQEQGLRTVLYATRNAHFAGYVTIVWLSEYPPFRNAGIPEIVDFNVLVAHRRKGIGTALMDAAEKIIAERSDFAGVGVGLSLEYGPAQILYVKRGYIPDGQGVFGESRYPGLGDRVTIDHGLALYFTKKLHAQPGSPAGDDWA